jgi:hypothetical protein
VSGVVNTSYQVGSALGLAAVTALRGLVRRHRELPGGIGDRRRGRGCCRAPPARRDPPPVDGGRATRRRGAAAGAHRLISGMRRGQRWRARHHSPIRFAIRFASPRSAPTAAAMTIPTPRRCRSGPVRWPGASWCRWRPAPGRPAAVPPARPCTFWMRRPATAKWLSDLRGQRRARDVSGRSRLSSAFARWDAINAPNPLVKPGQTWPAMPAHAKACGHGQGRLVFVVR